MKPILFVMVLALATISCRKEGVIDLTPDSGGPTDVDITAYRQGIVGYWVASGYYDKDGRLVSTYDTAPDGFTTYWYYSNSGSVYTYVPRLNLLDSSNYAVFLSDGLVRLEYGMYFLRSYALAVVPREVMDIMSIDEDTYGEFARYVRTSRHFSIAHGLQPDALELASASLYGR